MKLFKLMVLTLAVASLAVAMPIVGLYSTGLTSDGTTLGTVGGAEANWQVNGSTAYITQNGQFPFQYWAANDSGSQWISPQANYVSGGNNLADTPNGVFTYSLTFDLTGYDPTSASFSYRVAGDDYISSIQLNGNSIPGSGIPPQYGSLGGVFTVNSGFQAGLNTITVLVPNSSSETGNPSGFRLEVTESSVNMNQVPEPATFALVGLALAAIPVLRRRR
jgi:hypothetical protein